MNLNEQFSVLSISHNDALEWIKYKHYAKRKPSIEFSFGLFRNKIMCGVCTFGTPPRTLNNGESIFVNLNIKTFELNRLITNDDLPKNTLSFFVSKCLKMIPRPCCVVSYADHTFGHHGYIYQATNWIYTGLNSIHQRQVYYNGKEIHPRTACSKGFTNINKWAKEDENVSLGEYTKKHRYLKFIGNKKIISIMRKELAYPIKPYPKGDNKKYDASYKPTIQTRMFDF